MPGTIKIEGSVKDVVGNIENQLTKLDPTENISYNEYNQYEFIVPGGGGTVAVPLISQLTPTNTIKQVEIKSDNFVQVDVNALGDLPCRSQMTLSADPANYPADAIVSITLTNPSANNVTVNVLVVG
jgi:hypothetical protein